MWFAPQELLPAEPTAGNPLSQGPTQNRAAPTPYRGTGRVRDVTRKHESRMAARRLARPVSHGGSASGEQAP